MKIKMLKDFGGYNWDCVIEVTLETTETGEEVYLSKDKIMDYGKYKLAIPTVLEGEYFKLIEED